MKLIIDIPEEDYRGVVDNGFSFAGHLVDAIKNGTPISDNAKNGKEVLIKYCLKHSGEEIYDLLKRVFDASTSWTDSRSFIIDWLEKGVNE